MNGMQLLAQITSSKLNQEEDKHFAKHARFLTMLLIYQQKEAGSRILIDAIVCALIQAIHGIDKHFMFVINSPKAITSLINGNVTMWTGLTNYGLGFGDTG
ncbi:hypothetical protein FRC00_003251, partial [Tulasnella sp. 408]